MRVDVTDCPDVRVGDEVMVLGEQSGVRIGLEDVVRHQAPSRAGEIATAIPSCMNREYIDE